MNQMAINKKHIGIDSVSYFCILYVIDHTHNDVI